MPTMYGRMIKTPFYSLRATLCTLLLLSLAVHAQGCDGWFGSSCQYKCHCTGNNCDNNGDCTGGNTCVKGWFGPLCQYVDLSYTENDVTTREEFRDADDTTCNTDPAHQTVIMSFRRTFPFTWLRLLFSTEGLSLDNIEVTFNDGKGNSNIQCNNRRSALIDNHTIDIHCNVSVEVKQVRVTGAAIGYLCSFYISSGRNIALKQSASQGSTQHNYGASKAVDGDNRQRLDNGTCTLTQENADGASWTVIFSRNNYVNRYVIYNRGDCCQDRLKGFVLTAYDEHTSPVFTHTDTESPAQNVYTLTSVTHTSPIRSVNIRATNIVRPLSSPLLTLCEVEIYGDSQCPVTAYGRECEHQCQCPNNEPCFISTGMCPNYDCAVGYGGVHCDQPCKPTTWGPRCVNPCSGTCRNHQCDSVTGRCDECPSGKTGDQCNQNCPPTQYGSRCVDNCSTNCANRQCAGDNGRCNQCPAGKTGDHCDEICADGKYGIDCKKTCSINCKVSNHCDSLNGTCFDGCINGYMGDLCEHECEHGKYGNDCSYNCSAFCNTNRMLQNESPCHHISGTCLYGCVQGYVDLACHTKAQTSPPDSEPGVGVGVGIGVGVTVLVGVAVLGVYFYRKRKLTQRAKRERPPGYDPADTTTEEHNYNELFKSHDDYNLPTDEVSSSVTLHVPSKNSTVDNVQYVNADVSADVNQYEDIDQVTSESDQGQSSKAGENNSGYANC